MAFLVVGSAAGAGIAGVPAGTVAADSDAAVDVVLVVDRSESMSDDWDDLTHELGGIDDYLEDQGVDVRYAVVSYAGSPDVDLRWTGDFGEVESSLEFSTEGHVENASAAILEANSMSYRDDADRVVVLVTDEDDDGTAEEREQAKRALSSMHFVTVSPEDPSRSSCSNVLNPPCDDDESNELRRIAQDVDGDWIDVDSPARAVVEDTGAAIETVGTGSSSLGAVPAGSGGSDLRVANLTVNRSTVEVGQPVAITATIENSGESAGNFDALFADENGLLETRTIGVPEKSVRTVRYEHTYVEPDNYELFVTHHFAGRLEVVPRPDTTVETRTSANGARLVANVSDPRENASVAVPLGGLAGLEGDNVSLEALRVTPADDEDFRVAVIARSTYPNGTSPLPTGVRPAAYLTANATTALAEGENATTAFEYTSADDGVRLYRYEPNGTGWSAMKAEPVDESSERRRLVATGPGLSHFAVGVDEPAFRVTELDVASTSVTAGEPIEAAATVANEGAANGTYAATLVADGEVVDRTEVFVRAGESRRVDLGFVRHAAGEVGLSVGEERTATVAVEEGSDAEEAVTETDASDRTTTESDGQPGFGAVALVAALLISTLVAIRRR